MRTLYLFGILALASCKTVGESNLRDTAAVDFVVGQTVEADLATIHPTQFAVGIDEVAKKAKKYRELPSAEAKAQALAADPGLAVVGPGGELYLVDHHHLFKALVSEKVARAPVKIVDNFAALGVGEFWDHMDEQGLVFPYDEKGQGPLPSYQFPKTLAELKDDPYRTLAGLVTAAGGFTKVNVPFLEFRWAQYFRPRVVIAPGAGGMEQAVKEALAISHAPEARDLPGFIPPS